MRPSICLCMIVKNESKVIERCLASVKGLIDTWVISDTGSTDGTQDCIRRTLADIPGVLHEERWVDFGHNRSLNLQHARGKADYLLLVDADLEVRREGPLPPLSADAYMLRHACDTSYRIRRLVRGDLPWRYEGVTHEYLTCDQDVRQENLDALVIVDHGDGGSKHDKFERDARLLTGELQRNPDDPRTVFYLAQTMKDLGRTAEAVRLYQRRVELGGWVEEVYWSLLQIGVLKSSVGDWPHAMEAFAQAWESRPQRLEACYEMVTRLRGMRRYRSAHAVVSSVVGGALPAEDLLFTQPWVYRWGLLFEFSITSYWVGDHAGAINACDGLLQMPDLPEEIREQTVKNRRFSEEVLAARRANSTAVAHHVPAVPTGGRRDPSPTAS
ncbi:glycosyltransferase [Streptomyces sp. MUM 16J]|uniref:glycosyltransferase n=1 Tax=Streptomyces sp. MUM 16J TaxID=2791988 RepID=UPI001F048285|nr:glycosyltransferase [Streptomyces sp. MUM 16J]